MASSVLSASTSAYSAATELAPTRAEHRVLTLDVLRGFAMFGVLLSNLNDWYAPNDPTMPTDRALAWAQEWLWESRFYSLLAFLFGLGFAMQLLRAEERGVDIRGTYYRRLSALLVIGVLHGILIWQGDILTSYALVGFALPLFRGLSVHRLVIAAAGVLVVLRYVGVLILRAFHLRMVPRESTDVANWVNIHGSFGQIFAQRVHLYFDWLGRWPLNVYPGFLALMILGMAVARSGIVKDLPNRLPAIRKALWISLACVAVFAYLTSNIGGWWQAPSQYPESVRDAGFWSTYSTLFFVPYTLLIWSMAAVAACVLTIYSVRRPSAAVNRWLSVIGRMPLTTYLSQSVVSTLLFYHYGLGLEGRVGHTAMFAIAVAIFAVQIVVSQWWLARYDFGPVEWVWRMLTYGRRIPLRKEPRIATEPAAALI